MYLFPLIKNNPVGFIGCFIVIVLTVTLILLPPHFRLFISCSILILMLTFSFIFILEGLDD